MSEKFFYVYKTIIGEQLGIEQVKLNLMPILQKN
jgi:hypothetical protein